MIESKKGLSKRKHNKHHKNNKNYCNKRTKKNMKSNEKSIEKKYVQKGGEVKALEDVDLSNLEVRKYFYKDINWQGAPGKPPMDCVIL